MRASLENLEVEFMFALVFDDLQKTETILDADKPDKVDID